MLGKLKHEQGIGYDFTHLKGKLSQPLVVSLTVLVITANLLTALSSSSENREITGTASYGKDKLVLHSGKEKVILAALPPAALAGMNFLPIKGDTLTVRGVMSKGALVVREAVWKRATYVFRDSLDQPLTSGQGTWNVVAEDCIGCKLCTHFCPVGAITMKQTDQGVKAVIDPDQCTGCNICITGNSQKFNGCPTGAIKR